MPLTKENLEENLICATKVRLYKGDVVYYQSEMYEVVSHGKKTVKITSIDKHNYSKDAFRVARSAILVPFLY